MRAVLPILAACLVAGCGTASGDKAAPTKSEAPGVLVFGGTMNPNANHPPGGYYAMRPDGTHLRKLAFSNDVADVSFSADGRFAAMSDDSRGDTQVIVSRADGSDLQVVSLPENSYEQSTSLSPDGKMVALVYAPNPDAPTNVWSVSVDGQKLRQLTSTGDVSTVAWSPDGEHIAFTDQALLPGGDYEPGEDVYVVRTDGTDLQRIGGYASGYWPPAWSPDSTKIAFDDIHERIKVVDLKSKSVEIALQDAQAPVWSPDGKRMAVLRIAPCNGYVACMWSKMFVVDLSGVAEPLQVGPTFGEPRAFTWTTADVLPGTNSTATTPKPSS